MMPAPVMGAGGTDAGWVGGAAGVEAAGAAGAAGAAVGDVEAAKPVALMARNSANVEMTLGMGKDATTGRIAAGYACLIVITGR
jgi:hypothetical protein